MNSQFKALCEQGHEHEITKETDLQMSAKRPGLGGGNLTWEYKLSATGELLRQLNQKTFKSQVSGKVFTRKD
ncbi:MAG: hypothetical protein LBV14_04145 [Acidovorax sp.]|jgi:hypothetical protein|nr:hypothetical protein [Acidovorax sp.]